MSDSENTNSANDANQTNANVSELELLKSRAKMMNITFSNNIGVDALKNKINEAMNGNSDTENMSASSSNPLEDAARSMENENTELEDEPKPERVETLREKLQREQMKLVRCRITNMDPKKKDLPGEIVTLANEYLGTVRKFIPFGEFTEEGFHIPECLYQLLKSRRFLNIRTAKDRKTGSPKVTSTWAPEFAIEILPPLTEVELKDLAQAQIAAGSVDSQNQAA